MRLLRGNVPLVLDEYDYTFELGKAKLLRDGTDVLVIARGFMTMRSLEVAQQLLGGRRGQRGRAAPARPSDRWTRRPSSPRFASPAAWWSLPRKTTPQSGDWVRLSPHCSARRAWCRPASRQLALPDAFLDAGALPTLHDRYGISAERMAASLKSWLA